MASYVFTLEATKQYDLSGLVAQCQYAGLPVDSIDGSPGAGTVTVFTTRDLTTLEQSALASLVAAYDGRPRRKRPIYAILADVAALSASQQAAVWNDLTAGSPSKISADAGPNAAAILVLQFVSTSIGGLTNAEKNDGRRRAAAMYAQDVPAYLVHPPFDSGIAIAGDEPYAP